jgi:hypothetical protein
VCHLGIIAVRTGRRLQWDPARENIISDADAASRVTYTYRQPWELPKES